MKELSSLDCENRADRRHRARSWGDLGRRRHARNGVRPTHDGGRRRQAAGPGATAWRRDVAAALERLVRRNAPWEHIHEGDRNPWAHVRAALTASSVGIPLVDGDLALGEHQAIYLAEFDGPRERTLLVTVT